MSIRYYLDKYLQEMSSSNQNNNNNINPRPCAYGCGIQIYWNASVNEYWEVLTKKIHICPNIVSNKNKTSITPPSNAPKPTYYNNTRKASFSSANPKTMKFLWDRGKKSKGSSIIMF